MLTRSQIITAIVTPFTAEGQIDYPALEKLTEYLLQSGTQGFVVGGTTGETPTLTHQEKLTLYQRFAQIVAGRVPVIAGCGTNATQATLEFINEVAKISGIDYALTVVPYYNKPDQAGIRAHFEYLAKRAELPLIMYNIPSRTGVKLSQEVIVDLAKLDNIAGVKQCGSLAELEYIIDNTRDEDFSVFTGEDAQALAAKKLGAVGVISVAAPIYGEQMTQMYQAFAKADQSRAKKLEQWLLPKMQALFMYPSPAPVKAVLNAQGFAVGGLRLPLLALNATQKQELASRLGLAKNALSKRLSLDLGEMK